MGLNPFTPASDPDRLAHLTAQKLENAVLSSQSGAGSLRKIVLLSNAFSARLKWEEDEDREAAALRKRQEEEWLDSVLEMNMCDDEDDDLGKEHYVHLSIRDPPATTPELSASISTMNTEYFPQTPPLSASIPVPQIEDTYSSLELVKWSAPPWSAPQSSIPSPSALSLQLSRLSLLSDPTPSLPPIRKLFTSPKPLTLPIYIPLDIVRYHDCVDFGLPAYELLSTTSDTFITSSITSPSSSRSTSPPPPQSRSSPLFEALDLAGSNKLADLLAKPSSLRRNSRSPSRLALNHLDLP